jgi:ABC-type xylose transport system permease subunit
MSKDITAQLPISRKNGTAFRRVINLIGVDNLSLLFALLVLVFLVSVVSGWFGFNSGDKFFTWQNLMNSLAQAIVIVGLLAVGESVVIIAGALDISVGSIASIGSVVSASVLVGAGTVGSLAFIPTNNVLIAVLAGIAAGVLAGVINGLSLPNCVIPLLLLLEPWPLLQELPFSWRRTASLSVCSHSHNLHGWPRAVF